MRMRSGIQAPERFEMDMAGEHRWRSLDLLRGFAIFAVLAFHVFGTFNFGRGLFQRLAAQGYLGVQLFFIVSSLTMCLMWERRAGEEYQTLKFYIRRFFRIAPPFWIAMVVYAFVDGVGPSGWAPNGIGPKQFLTTAAFIHTFSPDTINAAVPGGWSIGVEMLFYLFFPFLVLFDWKPSSYLLAGIAVWFLNIVVVRPGYLSMFGEAFDERLINEFVYFQFFSQAPIFFAGIALYKLVERRWERLQLPVGIVIAWLLLAFVSKFYFGLNGMPFFWLAVFGLMSICAVVLHFGLSWRPFNYLGEVSYSVYLSHFGIIHGVSTVTKAVDVSLDGPIGAVFAFVLILLLSVLIGAISRNSVERWSTALGKRIVDVVSHAPTSQRRLAAIKTNLDR